MGSDIRQVALLPAQLSRLAEVFPEGGAVRITQDGSTVTAFNGEIGVTLNAKGRSIKEDPNQEKLNLC